MAIETTNEIASSKPARCSQCDGLIGDNYTTIKVSFKLPYEPEHWGEFHFCSTKCEDLWRYRRWGKEARSHYEA